MHLGVWVSQVSGCTQINIQSQQSLSHFLHIREFEHMGRSRLFPVEVSALGSLMSHENNSQSYLINMLQP
jgi:hypothetical protein